MCRCDFCHFLNKYLTIFYVKFSKLFHEGFGNLKFQFRSRKDFSVGCFFCSNLTCMVVSITLHAARLCCVLFCIIFCYFFAVSLSDF